MLSEKDLFNDIQEDLVRNKNQSQFLFNIIEDQMRVELEDKDANLQPTSFMTHDMKMILVGYILSLNQQDKKPVLEGYLAILKGGKIG